jgi:putative sigma-54 modulation protein
MNVDYTGRQYEITPAIKKEAEAGLRKLTKILGDNFEAKVILSVERRRCKAEVTVTARNRPKLVGMAEAMDMTSALDEALERTERQAISNKARWRNLKRQPKKEKAFGPESVANEGPRPAKPKAKARAAATAAIPHSEEPHVVQSRDGVAEMPMSLQEAVKECEYRDREVLVFRDESGDVKVLHRRRDGKLELIDVP